MFGIGRKITNEMIDDKIIPDISMPKTIRKVKEAKYEVFPDWVSKKVKEAMLDNPSMSLTDTLKTKFYQTEYARETIAIIEDPDGSISIGIARAGKEDNKNRRVSSDEGMRIAEGRAIKARTTKMPLIKKNYLRGLHAMRVEV